MNKDYFFVSTLMKLSKIFFPYFNMADSTQSVSNVKSARETIEGSKRSFSCLVRAILVLGMPGDMIESLYLEFFTEILAVK